MSIRTRQFLHDEWLQLVVLAVSMIAALAAMPFATERVPMQWNLRGQVNWYAPKEWGLLVLPLAMLLTYGVLYWREALDRSRLHPEDGRLNSHGKATRTIRLVMSVMLLGLCLLQIASALGRHPDMGRLASAAGPFVLALVGNFFGKLKPNGYIGVRVPWTLRSETVWRKTHRVAGWLYTVAGLVAGTLCLLLPSEYVVEILAAWLALIIVVPLGVAWQAAREERTGQPATAGLSLGWMAALETVALIGAIVLYFQHAADSPHAPDRDAARAAAEQWLVHLDEARYAEAWQATGDGFRKAVTLPAQIELWNRYRAPAGAKLSRKLREAKYAENPRGAPAGKYVIVRFDTEFEHLPIISGHQMVGIETVVEKLQPDDTWRVEGYFIK